MRGQDCIIRMRVAGYRPAIVWLLVLDEPCPRSQFHDAELILQNGGLPEVHVGTEDLPGALDLRALTGLLVLLQGTDRQRLRDVFSRLKTFDPARVIVSSPDFVYDHPGDSQ